MICRKEWLEKTDAIAMDLYYEFTNIENEKTNITTILYHPNNIVIDICKAYKEWKKGCSNALPDKLEECKECTEAFLQAVSVIRGRENE